MKYFATARSFCATVVASILVLFALPLSAGTRPPTAGSELPAFKLSVPKNPGERQYLGLEDNAHFTVPQIRAKVVIIEIFSMY